MISNCLNSSCVDSTSVDEDLGSSNTGEGCVSMLGDFFILQPTGDARSHRRLAE